MEVKVEQLVLHSREYVHHGQTIGAAEASEMWQVPEWPQMWVFP